MQTSRLYCKPWSTAACFVSRCIYCTALRALAPLRPTARTCCCFWTVARALHSALPVQLFDLSPRVPNGLLLFRGIIHTVRGIAMRNVSCQQNKCLTAHNSTLGVRLAHQLCLMLEPKVTFGTLSNKRLASQFTVAVFTCAPQQRLRPALSVPPGKQQQLLVYRDICWSTTPLRSSASPRHSYLLLGTVLATNRRNAYSISSKIKFPSPHALHSTNCPTWSYPGMSPLALSSAFPYLPLTRHRTQRI